MNPRNVTTTIYPEKCIGCGACIQVCPSDTISMMDGIARVTGEKSLSCGHCAAICPENAIHVSALSDEMTRFDTFDLETDWLGFGEFPTKDLVQLMASRRSCRNFKTTPVKTDVLVDLIKIGTWAPSGTNTPSRLATPVPISNRSDTPGRSK